MPQQDPILEELRAVRDAIAKASDDDLTKIVEAARERQRKSGRTSVRLKQNTADAAKKAS